MRRMDKTVAFNSYNVVKDRFDNNILECKISDTSINIRNTPYQYHLHLKTEKYCIIW